ncbi:MAG: hypothetical protein ACKVS5_14695 [Parvularculaceae bacterium]
MKRIVMAGLVFVAAACTKSSADVSASQESAFIGRTADGQDALVSTDGLMPGAQRIAMAPAGQNGPAGNSATRGRASRSNVLRLEPQVILDATGFAQPMAAATIFVPHGWRTEGGVYWARDFACTNGYNFLWTAASPDGAMSIGIVPQTAWDWNNSNTPATRPGCELAAVKSARDYLQGVVAKNVRGARILDYRERPDLSGLFGPPTRTAMPMGEARTWTEAGEVFFAFQDKGRDMRGSIAAAVQFSLMTTDLSSTFGNDPTINPQNLGGMQMRTEALTAFAHPGYAATAPNGQFNFAFFEALRKSIRPNQQWSQAIAGHNAVIGQVALDEARKRSKMISETNDYISRLRQDTWNAQAESADRRAREFGELIKGVETYRDPDAPGGTAELSATYSNAWRLNDGTYVLTDDVNFDPWRDLQLEGKKLEPQQ